MEHLFARLWSWWVVRDIWLGSHEDFCCLCHVYVCFPRGGGFQGGHTIWCCVRAVQEHPLGTPEMAEVAILVSVHCGDSRDGLSQG